MTLNLRQEDFMSIKSKRGGSMLGRIYHIFLMACLIKGELEIDVSIIEIGEHKCYIWLKIDTKMACPLL